MPSPKPKDTPAQGGRRKKPRPPDDLFDAVAEVTGSDPAVSRAHVAKVRHLLAAAVPPYAPDEVREFGRRYRELCPWAADENAPPSLGVIEKYIGRLRAAQPAAHSRAGWGWKGPSDDAVPEV